MAGLRPRLFYRGSSVALITATEVTVLTDISASVLTIIESQLVEHVTDRINQITGNQFTTEICAQDRMTFDGSALTVTASSADFAENGFAAGDEIYIYRSYRNDGYYTVGSVSEKTLTLESGSTITDELSGRSIIVSLVSWPRPLKQIAANMIKYDLESRRARDPGVRSRSLGPWSESYAPETEDGYPAEILEGLRPYRIARLM